MPSSARPISPEARRRGVHAVVLANEADLWVAGKTVTRALRKPRDRSADGVDVRAMSADILLTPRRSRARGDPRTRL